VRIEVVQELDPGDARLEQPWASPTDPKLRYIDLKKFPEKIDQLEECRAYPALARLLGRINAPGAVLRSAKCDAWTTRDLTEDEQLDFKFPVKVGSYVDVIFDQPEHNTELEPHLRLGEKIGQLLRDLRVQAQSEIAVRRCLFHPEESWGYSSTIFVHAYGSTVAEAKEEWSRAIAALGDGLARIDQDLRHSLARLCEDRPRRSM
jgi:hypothetical protein